MSGAKVIYPGMMSRTDNSDLMSREDILYLVVSLPGKTCVACLLLFF